MTHVRTRYGGGDSLLNALITPRCLQSVSSRVTRINLYCPWSHMYLVKKIDHER